MCQKSNIYTIWNIRFDESASILSDNSGKAFFVKKILILLELMK